MIYKGNSGSSNSEVLSVESSPGSGNASPVVKDDISTELEKLRLELRHIQGAYKLVQDESVDASHQVVELASRRMEEEAQLREIQSRVDKANDDVQEDKAHRYAAEEAATHAKDLVRAEVMEKNRLLVKASKDTDKKLRLEKLFVLQGNSYSTFLGGD